MYIFFIFCHFGFPSNCFSGESQGAYFRRRVPMAHTIYKYRRGKPVFLAYSEECAGVRVYLQKCRWFHDSSAVFQQSGSRAPTHGQTTPTADLAVTKVYDYYSSANATRRLIEDHGHDALDDHSSSSTCMTTAPGYTEKHLIYFCSIFYTLYLVGLQDFGICDNPKT